MSVPCSPDKRPISSHPLLLIALHWLTVGSILFGVGAILLRELVDGRTPRLWLLDLHRSLGLVVFALVILRLLTRWHRRRVLPDHGLSRSLAVVAGLGHAAIYLLLLAVPVLGWWQTSLRGQTIHLFGLIPLPPLTDVDVDLAEILGSSHEIAAWGLLLLVAAHVSAALWHHFIRRDGVLRSMLPWLSPSKEVGRAAVTDSPTG